MHKHILLFVFLFALASTFGLLTEISDAAQVPTLRAQSKTRPSSTPAVRKNAPPKAQGQHAISLGKYRDINHVKQRVGSYSRRTASLPNIKKQISSKCVMIMDAKSGKTIYAVSPDTPRQPASTIKVLTGMIALQSLNRNDSVGVSRKASKMPRSKVYLDTRKKYLATDLINAVLLASANDASVAIAEKIGGSEEKFAYMMTLRAKLWGAKRTVCKTASGLTAKGQHSTARDLANIFRHAMKNPEFAKRMKKRKVSTTYGKTLYNHNKALWRVKGTQGGKTGYTSAARQTYVGQFTRDGESIVVAIMGSETMWSDVKKLVDYGFKKKKRLRLAANSSSSLSNSAHIN